MCAPIKDWHHGEFTVAGRRARQSDKGTNTIDQEEFVKALTQRRLTTDRRRREEAVLTNEEMTQRRSLLRKLVWPACEAYPTINFAISKVAHELSDVHVKHSRSAIGL